MTIKSSTHSVERFDGNWFMTVSEEQLFVGNSVMLFTIFVVLLSVRLRFNRLSYNIRINTCTKQLSKYRKVDILLNDIV